MSEFTRIEAKEKRDLMGNRSDEPDSSASGGVVRERAVGAIQHAEMAKMPLWQAFYMFQRFKNKNGDFEEVQYTPVSLTGGETLCNRYMFNPKDGKFTFEQVVQPASMPENGHEDARKQSACFYLPLPVDTSAYTHPCLPLQKILQCLRATERTLLDGFRQAVAAGACRVSGMKGVSHGGQIIDLPHGQFRACEIIDLRLGIVRLPCGTIVYHVEAEGPISLELWQPCEITFGRIKAPLPKPGERLLTDTRSFLGVMPRTSSAIHRTGSIAQMRNWLEGEMAKSRDVKPHPKNHYRSEASKNFGLSGNKFDEIWRETVEKTGAEVWARAGSPKGPRKSKQPNRRAN